MLVSLCLAILKIYDEEVASEVAVSSSKATALP
jgi:hypothetical protein